MKIGYVIRDLMSVPSGVGEGNAVTVKFNNSTKPLGLPTGSWTRVLETASQKQGVKNYMLYDQKARPARVATLYPDNGKTITDTEFNFIGDPKYTLTTHKKNASTDELKIKETYTYTAQGRLNFVRHQVNNEPSRILTQNSYDELGRLLRKKVGGTSVLSSDELQIVDYKYNIRGWLTDINNVNNLNQPGGGPVDLFAFKINYNTVTDDINGQVKKLYNGNISETLWRSATDNVKRKYGYSYDHQHRLTAAYYQLPGTVAPRSDSYSTSYRYDENGNISSLKRNGKEDDPNLLIEIDDLDYTYDQGNRLLKVKDATNNPSGFNMNGAGINAQYAYDDFGNLKTDPYKKISHISYNHLNLPVKITFTGGETIEYTYLADGTKLKKTAKDAESNTTTTEYRGGFQYKNNILEFFPHSEGYVKATEAVNGYIFNYVFTHTDHLGNIRVKYTKHPQTGDIQILEEDHYYPYGLTHEGYNGNHRIVGLDQPGTAITLIDVTPDVTDPYKYKFNGMEYQDEFDVNVYDFGARNYDPALGRWMNIDPLSEMMRRHSPYNYAFNNPVYFIDPDGMLPTDSYGMSTATGAVDRIGGFNVHTFDENGKSLDFKTVSSLDGVGYDSSGTIFTDGGAALQNDFNKQVDVAFGDQADKPVEPSQANLDKAIEKTPTLSDMRGDFKGNVPVTFVDVDRGSEMARTTGSGETFSNVEVAVYLGAFKSWRFLAQTLFHEFIHVQDFQSLTYYNIFCGFDGRFSTGTAEKLAEAISEIRAYRMGHQVTGSSLENSEYKRFIKLLKDNKVDYKF